MACPESFQLNRAVVTTDSMNIDEIASETSVMKRPHLQADRVLQTQYRPDCRPHRWLPKCLLEQINLAAFPAISQGEPSEGWPR